MMLVGWAALFFRFANLCCIAFVTPTGYWVFGYVDVGVDADFGRIVEFACGAMGMDTETETGSGAVPVGAGGGLYHVSFSKAHFEGNLLMTLSCVYCDIFALSSFTRLQVYLS